MSKTQIAVIMTFWILAMVPLGVALAVFVLTKIGILATPLPDHYRGLFAKVASLLAMGGWVGLLSILPGLGGALAVAGVWIGVLKMAHANIDLSEVASMYWDHLLLIALSAAALAVIGCAGMIFYVGWGVWGNSNPENK
jgi:hypothetical protein